MSRTVIVYSTGGSTDGHSISTSAVTWGDLKRDLALNSINFEGMKSIIGETKVTLESPEAQLPEGDFRLFLMPRRTKSGGGDTHASVPSEDPVDEIPTTDEEQAADPSSEDNHMESGEVGFEVAIHAVDQVIKKESVRLEEADTVRLALMMHDLNELYAKLYDIPENPVEKEMRNLAQGIDGV